MKDDRLRVSFDIDYVTAVGLAMFTFASEGTLNGSRVSTRLMAIQKQSCHAYIGSTRSTTGWAIIASRLDCRRLASLGR